MLGLVEQLLFPCTPMYTRMILAVERPTHELWVLWSSPTRAEVHQALLVRSMKIGGGMSLVFVLAHFVSVCTVPA